MELPMRTSFFTTNDDYLAALAHITGISTTTSLTYHQASISPRRERAPANPKTIRAIIDDYTPDFAHEAHKELTRRTARHILSKHRGDSVWFTPESMQRVLNSGVVPPPPEHPIVANVFDRIANQPLYYAARQPVTIPHHPSSFALAYALLSFTKCTPTYQPSLSGKAAITSVAIENNINERPPIKTSFDPKSTSPNRLPKDAARITLTIELQSQVITLESPIYVGTDLKITTTPNYLTNRAFEDPIQALATFIGEFTPDAPSQHFLDYAIAASHCLPVDTAASNIIAYINRQITQPALAYATSQIPKPKIPE